MSILIVQMYILENLSLAGKKSRVLQVERSNILWVEVDAKTATTGSTSTRTL
jgi:hypothetical protein